LKAAAIEKWHLKKNKPLRRAVLGTVKTHSEYLQNIVWGACARVAAMYKQAMTGDFSEQRLFVAQCS